MNEQGMEALKAAVVRQACEDFLSMLRKPGKRIPYDFDEHTRRKKWEDERSLTRWFYSADFRFWCSVDGAKILAQLRDNHAHGFGLYLVEPPREGECA